MFFLIFLDEHFVEELHKSLQVVKLDQDSMYSTGMHCTSQKLITAHKVTSTNVRVRAIGR